MITGARFYGISVIMLNCYYDGIVDIWGSCDFYDELTYITREELRLSFGFA